MSDPKPGKYAAALAAINEPIPNQVALPLKAKPPEGKRRRKGWRPRQVLLKAESIRRAEDRLRQRNDRTDFSDLMQALLEAWLDTLS